MVLKDIEERLDAALFARINKSVVVNLDSVVEIKKLWHGDFEILLTDRARVRLSRRYRGRVLAPKTQDSPKERPEIREDEAS
jgi:two-component system, LytTR family, response regulator